MARLDQTMDLQTFRLRIATDHDLLVTSQECLYKFKTGVILEWRHIK